MRAVKRDPRRVAVSGLAAVVVAAVGTVLCVRESWACGLVGWELEDPWAMPECVGLALGGGDVGFFNDCDEGLALLAVGCETCPLEATVPVGSSIYLTFGLPRHGGAVEVSWAVAGDSGTGLFTLPPIPKEGTCTVPSGCGAARGTPTRWPGVCLTAVIALLARRGRRS